MDTSRNGSEENLLSESEEVEVQPEGHTEKPRDKSCFKRWVTVEPGLMLFFTASIAAAPLTDQYVLHIIQENNNFTSENKTQECFRNVSDPNYIKEQELQAQASKLIILFSLVALLPSLIVTTQLGAYSDMVGRKIALICPLIGGILRSLLSVFIVQYQLPLHVMTVAFVAEGMCGGISSFVMASFAYIADVTLPKDRSLRIFILEIAMGIGIMTSSIGVGYLIRAIGYMYPFVIIGGLHIINLLYILFFVEETILRDVDARFFTIKHYTKLFAIYGKDDGKGRRWKLHVSIWVMFLACITQLGGSEVLTYFQLDSPICFDSVDIGLWTAGRYVVVSVSGIVALKLFYNRAGDLGLMVISCLCGIVFYTWIAFITDKLVMYIAALVSICTTLVVPIIRSYSSKIVSQDEQGATFSVIANVQTLSIPLGNVIFNTIYSATVTPPNFKGTTFLTQAGVVFVALLLVIVLIIGTKIEKKRRGECADPEQC